MEWESLHIAESDEYRRAAHKPGELLTTLVEEEYQLTSVDGPFVILETGCIRNLDPKIEDRWDGAGWSTLYFARWMLAHRDAELWTVDIDENHIELAKDVLGRDSLFHQVKFHRSESVELMKTLPRGSVQVAYLDSSDDLEHAFSEFRQCERIGVRLVIMDDFMAKARLAAAYALGRGYSIRRVERLTVIEIAEYMPELDADEVQRRRRAALAKQESQRMTDRAAKFMKDINEHYENDQHIGEEDRC